MFFEIGVLKVCNIHRKMPVLESLFSKVPSLEAYTCLYKPGGLCWPIPRPASVLEIHQGFDYINQEIDDIYMFNIILCVFYMYFFIFFAISFPEVLKHVKLFLRIIMNVKQNICF